MEIFETTSRKGKSAKDIFEDLELYKKEINIIMKIQSTRI